MFVYFCLLFCLLYLWHLNKSRCRCWWCSTFSWWTLFALHFYLFAFICIKTNKNRMCCGKKAPIYGFCRDSVADNRKMEPKKLHLLLVGKMGQTDLYLFISVLFCFLLCTVWIEKCRLHFKNIKFIHFEPMCAIYFFALIWLENLCSSS